MENEKTKSKDENKENTLKHRRKKILWQRGLQGCQKEEDQQEIRRSLRQSSGKTMISISLLENSGILKDSFRNRF